MRADVVGTGGASGSSEFLEELYRGGELLAAGDVAQAKAHLERAHELQPKNEKSQNLLGLAYFKLGMFERAAEVYEALVRENPVDPTLRVNLGLVYLKANQLQRAIREFETATDLAPEHKKAQNYLGLALAQAHEYARAKEHFVLAGSDAMVEKMDRALAGEEVVPGPQSGGPQREVEARATVSPPLPRDVVSEGPPTTVSWAEQVGPGGAEGAEASSPPNAFDGPQPTQEQLVHGLQASASGEVPAEEQGVVLAVEEDAAAAAGTSSEAVDPDLSWGDAAAGAGTSASGRVGGLEWGRPGGAGGMSGLAEALGAAGDGLEEGALASDGVPVAQVAEGLHGAAAAGEDFYADGGGAVVEQAQDGMSGGFEVPVEGASAAGWGASQDSTEGSAWGDASAQGGQPAAGAEGESVVPGWGGEGAFDGGGAAVTAEGWQQPDVEVSVEVAAGAETTATVDSADAGDTADWAAVVEAADERMDGGLEAAGTASQGEATAPDQAPTEASGDLEMRFAEDEGLSASTLDRFAAGGAQAGASAAEQDVGAGAGAAAEASRGGSGVSVPEGLTLTMSEVSAAGPSAEFGGASVSAVSASGLAGAAGQAEAASAASTGELLEPTGAAAGAAEALSRTARVASAPEAAVRPEGVKAPVLTPVETRAPEMGRRTGPSVPVLEEVSAALRVAPGGGGSVFHATEQTLVIKVDGELLSRASGLVAWQGALEWEPERRRQRGRRAEATFGEGDEQLFRVKGAGTLVLEPRGRRFWTLELGDGSAYFREAAVFAFQEAVMFENGKVPGSKGVGDVELVHLTGGGQVLLVLPGAPRTLDIRPDAPVTLPADRLVGWTGSVSPRLLPGPGPARAAVELTGEGIAIFAAGLR